MRAAGHDVTVIGVTDHNVTTVSETLDNGVKLVRVDSRRLLTRTKAVVAGFLVLTLLSLMLVVFLAGGALGAWLVGILLVGLFALATLFFVRSSPASRHFVRRIMGCEKGLPPPEAFVWLIRLLQSIRFVLQPVWLLVAVVAGKGLYFAKVLAIFLAARRVAPQIVHCHDAINLPVGVALKWATRCLLIYDAHEIYEEVAQASPQRAKVYRAIHRMGQHHVDGFVTINRSIAQWYAEHYPHLPPAVVVKNATNVAGPIDYDGRLHLAAGLPLERKVLLYQGGFSKKRGLEYLVAAARHLSDDWTLVMMGWGTLEVELCAESELINQERSAQGRPPAVVFIPPAPHRELAQWTAGGTVGIIPYENIGLNHWFCTPNKLWEYPNAALPVLVSPFPELSAPVLEYGYGWLLPEDQDPQALGRLVAGLGREQIAQARANCDAFMRADNWQVYAEKLVELYRTLMPQVSKRALGTRA